MTLCSLVRLSMGRRLQFRSPPLVPICYRRLCMSADTVSSQLPNECHLFVKIPLPIVKLVNNARVFGETGVDGERQRSFSSRIRCEISRESGGYSSGESILVDQQLLERELQIAIEEENYAKAAKLRDDLRSLQEDSKVAVMAANAEFYNSFKNGDVGAMQALWSKGDHVCCVHPGALGISGYETVVDSWIHVWANYEFPLEIELREVRVHVRGDVGYVTCVELVKTRGSSWGGQFVTNVFERINGNWFICVHHASPVDF